MHVWFQVMCLYCLRYVLASLLFFVLGQPISHVKYGYLLVVMALVLFLTPMSILSRAPVSQPSPPK